MLTNHTSTTDTDGCQSVPAYPAMAVGARTSEN